MGCLGTVVFRKAYLKERAKCDESGLCSFMPPHLSPAIINRGSSAVFARVKTIDNFRRAFKFDLNCSNFHWPQIKLIFGALTYRRDLWVLSRLRGKPN